MTAGIFHHFGVPTNNKQEKENYIEGAGVSITDPKSHPYAVEFLRFDPDSPMPEIVKTQSHVAFMVADLDAALEGQNVVIEPFNASESLKCAFIMDGNALIELMQDI